MKNRWLLNLVLLGIIVSLSLLLVFKPGQEDESKKATLTTLKIADIKNVRLIRKGRKTIHLVKTDQRWRMHKPLKARANRFNVNNLVRLAVANVESRFEVSKNQLHQYGLDKPQAIIRLNDIKLEVGRVHPLKRQRYIKKDQFVYLVPVSRLRITEHPYTDFLSHRLLGDNIPLTELQLPQFKLRLKDGSWVMSPKKKGITSDQLNELVQEWKHASALTVNRYLGRPVTKWVTLRLGDGKKSLRLGILRRKPELVLYRKNEGLEYHFPEEIGKRLLTLKPAK